MGFLGKENKNKNKNKETPSGFCASLCHADFILNCDAKSIIAINMTWSVIRSVTRSVIRSDPWSGPWSDPVRSRFCWSRFEAKCLMLLTTTWLTWVKNIEWWLLIFLAWQNNVMQKAACDDTIISNISSVTREGLMDKFAVLVFITIIFAMLTFFNKKNVN